MPEAIGGALTLKERARKSVCGRCNNGVLSRLDEELCRRSYLSVIASQEIDSKVWQLWDIDHSAENLLVEARPEWEDGELKGLISYPQMIFERSGPQIRGNAEEMERVGSDQVLNVMSRAVYSAFQRYTSGKKRVFHRERVRTDLSSRGYRLPPRVYSPHSFSEIAENIHSQSFVLRYLNAADLRSALRAMSRLDFGNKKQFNCCDYYLGSPSPSISLFFDIGLTLRGMMKIAFNLLSAYCTKTQVDCDTFPQTTRLILGRQHFDPNQIAANGFVHAKNVEELSRDGCHSFRITTLEEYWIVYMSFFGGRICSVATFPGPNYEEWGTMEIVAPLYSKQWIATPTSLIRPLRVQVEWSDQAAITPTLRLQHSEDRIVVEDVSAAR